LFCKFKENKKEAAVNALKGGQPLPSQLWCPQQPTTGAGGPKKKKKKKKKKPYEVVYNPKPVMRVADYPFKG
jgi:hypothetical protein